MAGPMNIQEFSRITGMSSHTLQDGRYAEWSLDEYLARLPGRAADDESRRARRITAVHATDDAATAELELDYPTVRFVDYLTLLLINGDWVIVNKAFKALPKRS